MPEYSVKRELTSGSQIPSILKRFMTVKRDLTVDFNKHIQNWRGGRKGNRGRGQSHIIPRLMK